VEIAVLDIIVLRVQQAQHQIISLMRRGVLWQIFVLLAHIVWKVPPPQLLVDQDIILLLLEIQVLSFVLRVLQAIIALSKEQQTP